MPRVTCHGNRWLTVSPLLPVSALVHLAGAEVPSTLGMCGLPPSLLLQHDFRPQVADALRISMTQQDAIAFCAPQPVRSCRRTRRTNICALLAFPSAVAVFKIALQSLPPVCARCFETLMDPCFSLPYPAQSLVQAPSHHVRSLSIILQAPVATAGKWPAK